MNRDIDLGVLAMLRGAARTDYLENPGAWVRSNGEYIWAKQEEILRSVRDNRYTAVHSCHASGKSFTASRTLAWWIQCHPPGSAFVVSTAPSAAQVSAILWREVGKLHKASGLIGTITRAGYPQWYIGGELVGYGRKPADHEQSAFQGIHAQYPLIVIDEAGGVPEQLFNAVDALATNDASRVLAIGNPDDPGSHFARICRPGSGWNVIHLDGLRTPNMSRELVIGPDPLNPRFPLVAALMEAEGIPFNDEDVDDILREVLIAPAWVEERIHRWANMPIERFREIQLREGEEAAGRQLVEATNSTSLFAAKVRGDFSQSSSSGVIPMAWVERAFERFRDMHDGRDARGDFTLGIDVARQGVDQTVFAVRRGDCIQRLIKLNLDDTTRIADVAAGYLQEPRSIAVIDVIGIGAGVFDLLRRYKAQGLIEATPVMFNAAARTEGLRDNEVGGFKFLNDRAAAWWNMRVLLDPSRGSTIALPPDEELLQELIEPQYDFNVGGTIKIESKDDIRRRIGRSTDSADAVIQAFWLATGKVEVGRPLAWDGDRSATFGDRFPQETYDAPPGRLDGRARYAEVPSGFRDLFS